MAAPLRRSDLAAAGPRAGLTRHHGRGEGQSARQRRRAAHDGAALRARLRRPMRGGRPGRGPSAARRGEVMAAVKKAAKTTPAVDSLLKYHPVALELGK